MALLVCSLREGVGLAANVAFIVPECGACCFALSTRARLTAWPTVRKAPMGEKAGVMPARIVGG